MFATAHYTDADCIFHLVLDLFDLNFTEKDDAIFFDVKVAPKSSKTEIVGEINGTLKIKIKSPPVDGAANAELVKLLSKTFGVSKSEIEIVNGATSKNKRIKIYNLSAENFIKSLELFQLFPANSL